MSKEKKRKSGVLPLRLRNVLRGTHTPAVKISELRRQMPITSIPQLARAMTELSLRRQVYPNLFANTVGMIRPDDRELLPVDTAKEIAWCSSVVGEYADHVNKYLSKKIEIERWVIEGDYEHALAELEKLCEAGFYSLSTVEIQQAILQSSAGLNVQKDFLNQFLEKRRRNVQDTASYVVFHGSIRNESTTHIFSFRQQFGDRVRGATDDVSLRSWLLYHICDQMPIAQQVGGLLRTEQASPLLDWYETLIRLATYSIAYQDENASAFLESLLNIEAKVEDQRIKKLLCLGGAYDPNLSEFTFENLLYQDELLQSESSAQGVESQSLIQLAYEEVQGRLPKNAETSGYPESLSGSYRDIVLAHIRSLSSDVPDVQSFSTLMRMATNYRYTTLGASGHLPAWRQISTATLSEPELLRVEFVECPLIRVEHIRILPDSLRKRIIERFKRDNPSSLSLSLNLLGLNLGEETDEQRIQQCGVSVAPDRVAQARLHQLVAAQNWAEALPLAMDTLKSEVPSIRRDAARIAAACLLETGPTVGAVEFVVSQVLEDPFLSYSLPIARIVKRIDKSYRQEYAGRLSTPIILDLLKERSSQLESHRIYACEDFLAANGMTRPSQVRKRSSDFHKATLIYYLRTLCTPSIMQMSDVYEGTTDYENERIAVCSLLSDLDPENAKEYEAESRAITQNQIIRSGVSQVEENKIYVDELALRQWADVSLRESYTRYQALKKSGLSGTNERMIDVIRDVIEKIAPGTLVLELPKSEATELLVTMLMKLIDEFMTNPQHGLDRYLSMRIRHGSFAGRLRNPLETNRIITQREAESNRYRTNEYWLARLSHLDRDQHIAIDQYLRTFSREFDSLIESYSNDFIQVKGKNKPNGLFTIEPSPSGVLRLSDAIPPDTGFDTFLDHAFRSIRELLDSCLGGVRNHVETHLRTRIDTIFDTLSQRLTEIGVSQVHELDAAVHVAHTQLRQSIEEVKQWFYRNEAEKGPELRFEELVKIGLRCVTNIHAHFAPDLVVTSPDVKRLFSNMIWFSDIFFIVFDNIRLHSGTVRPSVHVSAEIKERDLQIVVRNEVDRSRINDGNKRRIALIKEAIKAGSYYRAVRSEGGTGLIKLRDNLRRGSSGDDPLDFFFDEHRREFVVKILAPMRMFETESEV